MHNKSLEQSLLGCILNDPRKIVDVEAAGGQGLFYTTEHQKIYSAIKEQAVEGQVDIITVATRGDFLKSRIYEISNAGPAPDMATTYIEQLKGLVVKRELQKICRAALPEIQDTDPAELLTKINQQARDLLLYTVKPRGQFANELVERMWSYYIENEGTPPDYLRTGFRDLDMIMDGLQPSEHIVIAARPSVGKSAFAMDIARNVAKNRKKVLFFSMEMTPERLVQRMFCSEALVSLKRLRNNLLKEQERKDADRTLSRVVEFSKNIILVPGQIGVNDVKARSLQEAEKEGVDLVIIDYLQLMKVSGEGTTNDMVGANSNGLQLLSKDLNIPVITLSQLSRSSEKERRRPVLSDLRDSGNIEQSGDKIILMYKENREDSEVELIVAKSKDGPAGTVKVGWLPDPVTFRNLSKEQEPPEVMAGARQWNGGE